MSESLLPVEFGRCLMTETPWVLIEKVAAAMYVTPDPNEPDYEPSQWPPTHPDDHAWWMAHAKAAINAIKESSDETD